MDSSNFEIGNWYEVLYILGNQNLKIYGFLWKVTEKSLVFDLSDNPEKIGIRAFRNPFSVRFTTIVDYWQEGTPIKKLPFGW